MHCGFVRQKHADSAAQLFTKMLETRQSPACGLVVALVCVVMGGCCGCVVLCEGSV
jgi:hypothetical protein